jgi:hypothetical protein
MLGIVIGVGAVIAMVAVGAGAAQRITRQRHERRHADGPRLDHDPDGR